MVNMIDERIIITKKDSVFFEIDCTHSQAIEINRFFKVYAPKYFFHPAYKCGQWDGKISFYDARERVIPIGLLPKLVEFATKNRYELVYDFDLSEFGNKISEKDLYSFYDTLFPPEIDIYPRDYQHKAILKALTNKRGICRVATGGGKSLLIYTTIRMLFALNMRTILVVPNISLVNQMLSDFKEYGWSDADKHVSIKYSGKKIDMEKPVLITTWQSVYKYPKEFFETFDCLMIDEVHGAGTSKNILNIAKMCNNAEYRIGFTGTMPENESERMTLDGYIGPVVYDLGAKTLIDSGVLSKIEIKNLILHYPEKDKLDFDDYMSEVDYIIGYEKRNESIDFILDQAEQTENIIFLMQRVKHLENVTEYIKTKYPNREVYIIYGGVDAEERETIRKLIETKNGVIIIATYKTMSTGVNIKKLHHVVFFSSYKAKITILQSIGRGLRTHETKNKALIWDVVDDMRIVTGPEKRTNYSYKHFKSRVNYYNEEGFANTTIELKLGETVCQQTKLQKRLPN